MIVFKVATKPDNKKMYMVVTFLKIKQYEIHNVILH